MCACAVSDCDKSLVCFDSVPCTTQDPGFTASASLFRNLCGQTRQDKTRSLKPRLSLSSASARYSIGSSRSRSIRSSSSSSRRRSNRRRSSSSSSSSSRNIAAVRVAVVVMVVVAVGVVVVGGAATRTDKEQVGLCPDASSSFHQYVAPWLSVPEFRMGRSKIGCS